MDVKQLGVRCSFKSSDHPSKFSGFVLGFLAPGNFHGFEKPAELELAAAPGSNRRSSPSIIFINATAATKTSTTTTNLLLLQ